MFADYCSNNKLIYYPGMFGYYEAKQGLLKSDKQWQRIKQEPLGDNEKVALWYSKGTEFKMIFMDSPTIAPIQLPEI